MGRPLAKLKLLVVLGCLGLVVGLGLVLFYRYPKPVPPLALLFLRYSDDFDWQVQDCAFLVLTNASTKAFGVTMPGGTNTFLVDTVFQRSTRSYLLNCEFMDQTSNGWTHWVQAFSVLPPLRNLNALRGQGHVTSIRVPALATAFAVLDPHTSITVRVPILPGGQKRKVAVLCREIPGLNARSFWSSPGGRFLLRVIPSSVLAKMTGTAVLRVWCDRELQRPKDGKG